MKKLTAKQDKFVDGKVKGMNNAEAARYAGHSEKTARRQGALNMTKHHILEAITQRSKKAFERNNIETDIYVKRTEAMAKTTLKEFVKYDSDRGEYIYKPVDEIPEEAWYGVKKMEMIELPNGTGRAMRLELFDPSQHIKHGLMMAGHLVERKEIGKPGEFKEMSDDEIERELKRMERAMRPITEREIKEGSEEELQSLH